MNIESAVKMATWPIWLQHNHKLIVYVCVCYVRYRRTVSKTAGQSSDWIRRKQYNCMHRRTSGVCATAAMRRSC